MSRRRRLLRMPRALAIFRAGNWDKSGNDGQNKEQNSFFLFSLHFEPLLHIKRRGNFFCSCSFSSNLKKKIDASFHLLIKNFN